VQGKAEEGDGLTPGDRRQRSHALPDTPNSLRIFEDCYKSLDCFGTDVSDFRIFPLLM